MAGIGFSLKRLFNKKGIFNLCRAYGYAGIITTGPMILGVVLLLGVSFVSKLGGMSDFDRELLNAMLTYSLLVSLFITGWFNLPVTRCVADFMYEGKFKKVMPSFFGAVSIMLVVCLFGYGTFLCFSGITVTQIILCLWFAMTLIVVWTQMLYMSALKDYKSIVLSFVIALMFGFLIALIFALFGLVSIEYMLFSVIIAYGVLAVRYFVLLLDYFPKSEGSYYSFLRWLGKYKSLIITGGFINLGLFGHLVIMYFGPLAVRIKGLFYGAPQYDIPALAAFFSLLITTVGFVTSVEVKFYPKYSNYYGLFNDRGAINDIKLAEKEMRLVLKRELTYLGHKQLFTTVLFIVLGPIVLSKVFPGISTLSLSVFRFLCVGYATYAIANSMMLILMYFEDYFGAMVSAILFGVFSCGASIWQILYGNKLYFGMGYFAGTIALYFFCVIRLEYYTRKLPYYLLSKQSIIPKERKGWFISISNYLDNKHERIRLRKEEEINERVAASLNKEGLGK